MARIASGPCRDANKTVAHMGETQMDQVTQQNAALVQQAAAAAGSLEDQSGQLYEAVARFRVIDNA